MSTYGPSHMEATLESYRAAFKADVAAGLRSPWVLPFGILAAPLVQLLYLSVPHVRRPWLYQARWLVVIFTVVWNLAVVMPRCSSTNMACAYGVGLACMSFTFQTFHFLVFTRPQFEAERVMRRRRRAVVNGGATANGNETVGRSSARQTANGAAAIPNGAAKADGKDTREQAPPTAVDEDMKEYLAAGYDYYWQPYPAEGTFWERFRWSYHFCMSSRGMGWNFTINTAPRFARPEKPGSHEPVDLTSLPVSAPLSGNTRPLTRRQFYLSRLRNVALAYIFIDFYSTILTVDPYFVAGPSLGGQPLPGFLASVSPWIVTAGRNLIALGAVLSAIQYIFGLTYVLLYFLYRQAGSVAGELWQFPTDYGDFLPALLDGGLAGFWGSWWHQTFRAFYMAPVDHLVRKGRLRRGTPYARAAYLLSAFLQSGLLHSAGSYTTLPETRWWRPTVFFLLCGVGIAVQDVTRAALWHVGLLPRLPRWAGRTANLLFVVVWLQAVAPFIVDDFTSNGTFLHEALPVSLFRLAGLGRPGDGRIWRLERDQMPRFVAGGWDRWWETGLAV